VLHITRSNKMNEKHALNQKQVFGAQVRGLQLKFLPFQKSFCELLSSPLLAAFFQC